jgi:hypothetical protein
LRLSGKVDIRSMRERNFPHYEEDSIDTSDIVQGPKPHFDPQTTTHWRLPKHPELLKSNNYDTSALENSRGQEPLVPPSVTAEM